MYLVEKELRGQFETIEKTVAYMLDRKREIFDFFADVQSICVLGCGSSFSVAKSIAMQFAQQTGMATMPLAAGDVLVNFESYNKILEKSALILLSRSGTTSELRKVAELCRARYPGIKILSICAASDTPVGALSDLAIEIPWAFDRAVCQTQTVSNLFVSGLLLRAIHSDDAALIADIRNIKTKAEPFAAQVEAPIGALGAKLFENVVVLADSAMGGLAEEGALAFKEICQRPSNFYNLLDARHGPMVMVGAKTLAIILVSRGDFELQAAFVKDISKQAGFTLVLGCTERKVAQDGVTELTLPDTVHDDLSALFMLYCVQLLCLKHALARGIDPDQPPGLDPWIKLDI
ncbi:MAG: SIS domain-containing protein [Oscillospiraceae bacterium]|nr:SIS domain-containing protein [Oscillospiraceae bacterium]